MIATMRSSIKKITVMAVIMYSIPIHLPAAHAFSLPFAPGEKLKYALRWGNIPAGELRLEILPIKTINGNPSYHFVMTAKSNSAVDLFHKVRDRIEAFTDIRMTRSILYKKWQNGSRGLRKQEVRFDWTKDQVQYTDLSRTLSPIPLRPGSFDPLSAFYFTRMAISGDKPLVRRPVTDGKKSFIGRARIIGRETITLSNGRIYNTLILSPETGMLGGIFKGDKKANLRVWITDDEKRIPVQIKAKVKVGHFIGELVSAEGV